MTVSLKEYLDRDMYRMKTRRRHTYQRMKSQKRSALWEQGVWLHARAIA